MGDRCFRCGTRRISPVRFGGCVAGRGTATPATWPPPSAATTTRRTRTTRTVSVLQVSPSPPASPCCLRAAWACSPTLGDDEDRRRRAIGCFASQLFPRQTRHDGIDCVHGLVKPCTVVPLGASAIHLLACVAKATAPLAPPLALCAAVQRSNPALDLGLQVLEDLPPLAKSHQRNQEQFIFVRVHPFRKLALNELLKFSRKCARHGQIPN